MSEILLWQWLTTKVAHQPGEFVNQPHVQDHLPHSVEKNLTSALPALRRDCDGGGPVRWPGGRGHGAARAALAPADDDEAGGGQDGHGRAARAEGDQHGDQRHAPGVVARRPSGVVQVLPAV